jgi:8'-apo-carotenoid 13,14-cleaving dioxygenase
MATTTRRTKAPMTPAAVATRVKRGHDVLAVSGTVPAELHGCLLRSVRHPSRAGELLESGIRLGEGAAKWYRAAASPSATRAAQTRCGGEGPDEAGPVAVARPAADPATRLWHTVATYPGLDHAEHLWLDPEGAVRRTEPFALPGAPLVHAVATTARFFVVFDLPVVHSPAAELIGARFPYVWAAGRPARVGLLDRWGGSPRWFDVDPCYVFNAVNAYDDGDRVIVDVIRHERAFASSGATPALWRWILDLRTGVAAEHQLSALRQEFPEVDPRVRCRRHRYVYSSGAGSVIRHDVARGGTVVRDLGQGRRAEQPVFIPKPGTSTEGVGWLVVVVHDFGTARGEVLILNAQDLTGPPVATVHLPVRLPDSVHTRWHPTSVSPH